MQIKLKASLTSLDSKFAPLQLTPPNKGTIIIGMCEGLLHLHSKDIVHQDLKPENIMVSGGLPINLPIHCISQNI